MHRAAKLAIVLCLAANVHAREAEASCTSSVPLCTGDVAFQGFSSTAKVSEVVVTAISTTQIAHGGSHSSCNWVGVRTNVVKYSTYIGSSGREFDSHEHTVANKSKATYTSGTYHSVGEHYWGTDPTLECQSEGNDVTVEGLWDPNPPYQCNLTDEACILSTGPLYLADTVICECYKAASPIIIDTAGNGYSLTSAAHGVIFDIDGNGVTEQVSWTVAGVDDAFLALDRNGNGAIDDGSELLGEAWVLPNGQRAQHGFEALIALDGGIISDLEIRPRDPVYGQLVLWKDLNHNGVSENNELMTLAEAGVASLELEYKESRRRDRNGNAFKLRATALIRDSNGQLRPTHYYDVYLRALLPPEAISAAEMLSER